MLTSYNVSADYTMSHRNFYEEKEVVSTEAVEKVIERYLTSLNKLGYAKYQDQKAIQVSKYEHRATRANEFIVSIAIGDCKEDKHPLVNESILQGLIIDIFESAKLRGLITEYEITVSEYA